MYSIIIWLASNIYVIRVKISFLHFFYAQILRQSDDHKSKSFWRQNTNTSGNFPAIQLNNGNT